MNAAIRAVFCDSQEAKQSHAKDGTNKNLIKEYIWKPGEKNRQEVTVYRTFENGGREYEAIEQVKVETYIDYTAVNCTIDDVQAVFVV